jgi:hypothetical protein
MKESDSFQQGLAEMKRKLQEYVDKGRAMNFSEVKEEPTVGVKPDRSKIKPLRKVDNYEGHFMAVDCSTRTLKRASNWGIYLLRVAYALVKGRGVKWGYEEKLHSEIGDAHVRGNALTHLRTELESKTALKLLCEENLEADRNSLRTLDEGDYVLLDGASFFGGKRGFLISLLEESLRRNINLLAISKQSPTLHDEKGRDFMAAAYILASDPVWVYHPVKRANKNEHLYGDVSIVKLASDSPRAFRCDVLEYLTNRDLQELLSPLTFISEDPRCLGYPVTLWLAHDFSTPSDSQLLYYHDKIEESLMEAGLLGVLRREELCCNFPDELHGVRRPFEWELIDRV